ncbi:MAG: glutamine--tRNA ligase/YqeY domain fusion protein, partial [Candidatus Gastranaerophilaceae bacterium]
ATEDVLFVQSIEKDIKWLGFDWKDKMFFASDYFEKMYEYAIRLIKMGKAYVCSLSEQEIREYRGTVTEPGKLSPYFNRSIDENLDLFQRMRAGEFKDGEHVLRAKIDMASPNMKMRDPLLYRIRKAHHHRTGDKWSIYPMYDFAHCISDYIEGITHSICTLEFENNRELYDWMLDELELEPPRPYQYEFARLNLNYTVMSKRKLLELVEKKYVNGWDDPRLPTISGLARRGITPEAIKKFCESIGIAKSNSVVDMAQFEFCIRDDLNPKAPRVLAVLKPLKVVIENYPEDKTEWIDSPYYPHDVPKEGSRKVPFSRELYIERDDFMENPQKGYFRLMPDGEVRLRHAYIIKCEKIIKDANGEIIELRCTYDPSTKSGSDVSGKKVKGTIHWVDANASKRVEVRLYDRLFKMENPENLEDMNPDSMQVLTNCFVEPAVIDEKLDTRYQFERQGYFYIDPVDSTDKKMVFNRIVALKDSWTKTTPKAEPAKTKIKSQTTLLAKNEPYNDEVLLSASHNLAIPKQVRDDVLHTISLSAEVEAKLKHYQGLGLNPEVAVILAKDIDLSSFFEKVLSVYNNPNSVGNWVANELSRELKDKNIADLPFNELQLAQLIELIDNKTISTKIAKDVFGEMLEKGGNPKAIVDSRGLTQISDESQLIPIIDKIITNNPQNVASYKEGKTNLLGFFVGQAMKETQGKANPKLLNELVQKKLN